ncbi:MAG: Acylphosphatase [Pseudomonas citronellolis]|nr:MAG: Acylphosphatase [Pseudomonas citronellolis]
MARICRHAFVSGKVQGVYYRQSTQEQAERLQVDGWVRNLGDGRVEVLMEGEEEAVATLEQWLQQGPDAAEVEALAVETLPTQEIVGFVVRR